MENDRCTNCSKRSVCIVYRQIKKIIVEESNCDVLKTVTFYEALADLCLEYSRTDN